jgi:hypothetical protein
MAILKVKKMIEDLENGSTQVLSTLTIANVTNVGIAATVVTAGVVSLATSAANAGTSLVAHWASSGTAALAGTSAIFATGL